MQSVKEKNQLLSKENNDHSISTTIKNLEELEDYCAQVVTQELGNSTTIQISLKVPLNTFHPSSKRFYEHLGGLAGLHAKKQGDYGRENDPFANVRASLEWNVPGWVGAMIRANDKIRRLQSLANKGYLENESAEDSLRDIAVYSIIALVLLEEELNENVNGN